MLTTRMESAVGQGGYSLTRYLPTLRGNSRSRQVRYGHAVQVRVSIAITEVDTAVKDVEMNVNTFQLAQE